jgi:SAM-dependent methyltransferase
MKCCQFFNLNNIYIINTLKHSGIYCLKCKNQKNIAKKKTIFNYFSYVLLIIDKLLKTHLRDTFCFLNISPEETYYYYKQILRNNKYENTKWFKYDTDFMNYLKMNNVNLKGKKLISISEEPGYFYHKIKNLCSDILFTALNKDVCYEMKSTIGVNTITYNANSDNLFNIVNEKFNIVLIRSVLNHIKDLENFINQIKEITSHDSIVICDFHSPSLQNSIVKGYDDYTFLNLYNDEFVKNIFLKNSFKVLNESYQEEDLIERNYSDSYKQIVFKLLYKFFKFQNNYKNSNFNNNYPLYDKVVKLVLVRN